MTSDETAGHRKRLREKFLKSGLEGFLDYEVVELLLSLGTPRRDCKPPAKEAVERFGSLRGVLEAPLAELQKISGIGPHNAFGIKLVQEVGQRFLKEKLVDRPVFESAQGIFDYLYFSMRGLRKELFKVILLNTQNQILDVIDLCEGTLNTLSVTPREVVETALKGNAASLIFVHNHPSGNPEPGKGDREVTRDLVFAGCIMRIRVLDHIIIGDNRYYSFAADGLIDKYEADFLGLRLKGVSEARRTIYRAGLFGGPT